MHKVIKRPLLSVVPLDCPCPGTQALSKGAMLTLGQKFKNFKK